MDEAARLLDQRRLDGRAGLPAADVACLVVRPDLVAVGVTRGHSGPEGRPAQATLEDPEGLAIDAPGDVVGRDAGGPDVAGAPVEPDGQCAGGELRAGAGGDPRRRGRRRGPIEVD